LRRLDIEIGLGLFWLTCLGKTADMFDDVVDESGKVQQKVTPT
jgi:hypothetical protein